VQRAQGTEQRERAQGTEQRAQAEGTDRPVLTEWNKRQYEGASVAKSAEQGIPGTSEHY